ncbi:unnamed protein product [Caretta caretta]
MAAESTAQRLLADGHSFCRACIGQCREGSDTDFACPQCGETAQQRNLTRGDASRAHAAYRRVPIQEAAQEYQIQTENERQKIVSEFQELKMFLEKEERLLLAQLGKLDEEIVKTQKDHVTQLSEEISRLSNLISELEGKYQKPASEFPQDVRSTLSRCEMGKFQQPVEISLELAEILSDFSQKNFPLTEILRKFKDLLPSELERKGGESLQSYTPVHVTLDPDTAHPELVLSGDRKSVTWDHRQQALPDNPERFDRRHCVLGCEGFTCGRHCWEVEMEVEDEGRWAVGVARESVRRKERINLNPKEGIWAVELWGHQFRALTSPVTPLSRVPSRIRVCLDCEWGQVTFFDSGTEAPIFTFPLASVAGERIRPWLLVRSSSGVRLRP